MKAANNNNKKILLSILLWRATACDTVARTWGHKEHNCNAKRIKMLLNLLFLFIVDTKTYNVKQNKPNDYISPFTTCAQLTCHRLLSMLFCTTISHVHAVPSTTISQTLPWTVVLECNITILSKGHKTRSNSSKSKLRETFLTYYSLWS